MTILKINLRKINEKIIKEILDYFKKGLLGVIPTDTVYGLSGDALNEKVIERIFEIKGRDFKKPLTIFIDSIPRLKKYCEINLTQEKFLERIWPGKVTVVLKRKPRLPFILVSGKDSVGVRIPDFPFIIDLVNELNKPIIATSANISGEKESINPFQILEYFKQKDSPSRGTRPQPDIFIDAGILPKSRPSTIIDLSEKEAKILREGDIEGKELIKLYKFIIKKNPNK